MQPDDRKRRSIGRALRWFAALLAGAALVLLGFAAAFEIRTSEFQARWLTNHARSLTYAVQPGSSSAIRFPDAGPYDLRLGYSWVPDFLDRLESAGFEVESQARFSPALLELNDWGISPPYREKAQAGLRVLDRNDETLFHAAYPERVYEDFDAIPPLVVRSLLFIENRELLDPRFPKRNPAVEWDRLAKAAFDYAFRLADPDRKGPGGSTLATQLEKSRHSPGGVTGSAAEKLRQMAAASLRAYREGEETMEARKRIVVTYLNALPGAAVPGLGEVVGLAAGLEGWFGSDFDTVNALLWSLESQDPAAYRSEQALAFKQVLALLIAQRRPTHFLIRDRAALLALTDSYLRILAREGIIAEAFRDAALAETLAFRRFGAPPRPKLDRDRKSMNVIRAWLVSRLGLEGFYDLDRLDLTAESTLDQSAQQAVRELLDRLADPAALGSLGLKAPRLLERGDPAGVAYSFLLYEAGEGVNWLRIQADNIDQPFDVGDGAKLDLGSTAKLRTLVTYLEIIASLHKRYAGTSPEALRSVEVYPSDRLTRWVIDKLQATPDISLPDLLAAAMDRSYSASPNERFFTAGGQHRFGNFDSRHDHRVMPVRDAFRESVNLVFVRLMRDIVNYFQFQVPGSTARLLEDPEDPLRRDYLERFADREGRLFLSRFFRRHAGRTPDDMIADLLDDNRFNPTRQAAMLRFLEPDASLEAFQSRVAALMPQAKMAERRLEEIYDQYGPGRYDLNDQGYIAKIHPLELWLVAYLIGHPQAGLSEVIAASGAERIAVYRWLFDKRRKKAQDLRIRSLLEIEAFLEIHRAWKRQGYPFDRLVPSYATSIGSSADRPAALAELMGIILNDGIRYPSHRIRRLTFAEDTPYETTLAPRPSAGERVLPSEVAAAVRAALLDTVERGTAKRAYSALRRDDGSPLPIGGKTGTGDHKAKTFAPGGRLLAERTVGRAASFVFFIDDRYFGVVTAHVTGPEAANYKFTSALSVQLFSLTAPILLEMMEASPPGVTAARP